MEPRRFAWWFGYPFLALGALAWALQEERLVAPVILLFGATGVALAVDGIRTDVVEARVDGSVEGPCGRPAERPASPSGS